MTGSFPRAREVEKVVRDALKEYWDLPVDRVTRLVGGRNALNWRIEGPRGVHVAKLIRPGDSDLDQFVAGLRIAAVIDAPDLPVPVAAPDRAGQWVRELPIGALSVLRWVPGVPLEPHRDSDVEATGSVLARLHERLEPVEAPTGVPPWPWTWLTLDELGEELPGDAALVASAAADAAVPHDASVGLLHGDPTASNFVTAGDVTGVLDWGSVLVGPVLYDLAVLQIDMERAGCDSTTTATLVRAYCARRPGVADAVDRLPTLRRLRYAAEVVYFTSRLRLAGRTADELAEAENGLQRARGDLRRCPGHRSRLDSHLRDTL